MNPFEALGGLWAAAEGLWGEWAYVGASYGLGVLILGGLIALYVGDAWRAAREAKRSTHSDGS